MGFLDKLNEIGKPKTFEAQFDFGKGDGEETLTFRALTYNERKRIIADRMEKIGVDKDGNDKWGMQVQKIGFDFNAEVLSASWIRPDGKSLVTKEALMTWDGDLVDKLGELCRESIGLFKEAEKDKAEGDENPSKPQS
jgi:hypothetical protein